MGADALAGMCPAWLDCAPVIPWTSIKARLVTIRTAALRRLNLALGVEFWTVHSMCPPWAPAPGWRVAPQRKAPLYECAIAVLGTLVASLLILMKLPPFAPSHFSRYEFLALGLWCLVGALLRKTRG